MPARTVYTSVRRYRREKKYREGRGGECEKGGEARETCSRVGRFVRREVRRTTIHPESAVRRK